MQYTIWSQHMENPKAAPVLVEILLDATFAEAEERAWSHEVYAWEDGLVWRYYVEEINNGE